MCGLHWKCCLVYIDDILVFGNDFESALHNLELVLDCVAGYGLQLKSTKCNLFRTSVPFLGHIVGHAGLECDPDKLSAVANWIPPSTIKGVRQFLGFTGYYRKFVPDYSTVAQPLVRLLGKIIAAQKIDKDISIVREWISAQKFPTCVQDFAPASYELKAYWIGHHTTYGGHFGMTHTHSKI